MDAATGRRTTNLPFMLRHLTLETRLRPARKDYATSATALIFVAGAIVLLIELPDAFSREPVLRVQPSSQSAELPFFSLDTEGTGREARNLLRRRFRGNSAQ